MSIRILIADDHKIIRDGLRNLISQEKGMEVVAETGSGRDALQLIAKVKPDVVIMDISMPDLNGVEATRQIIKKFPRTRVIALSMHADKRFITGMFDAGASAYLLKDCSFEEMAYAIRRVHSQQMYLCSKISGMVIQDFIRQECSGTVPGNLGLTARENEILQLLVEGKSSKEIAGLLQLSLKTVETHRQHVMQKLNIHNIADLTKFAIRQGLTTI